MALALALRRAVFIDEQRVPEDLEIDEHDRDDRQAVHAIVRKDPDGLVLATGRMYPIDERTVQLGRMAVRTGNRRLGIGRLLLAELLCEARRRGFVTVVIHAQDYAIEFYRKAGFISVGDQFLEAGIVHRTMTYELR